ncbi:MAG: hypothetical protein KQH79_00450 [Bacteroidetes bacterium]|nr:hypothetical protein [Bacteroidota bacterium]
MRSIFGRIHTDHTPLPINLFEQSLDQLSVLKDYIQEKVIAYDYALGQINFPTHKEITTTEKSELILLSDAVIYNKHELLRDLDIGDNEITSDELILKSYEEWGEKCVHHLIGDFAFTIWNKEAKELFCARDHLGVKPFHYYFEGNTFIFSSDIAAILAQKDLTFSIDQQQVADSLSIIKSEKERTTYNEIKSLPPGHSLTLKNGQIELKEYWRLQTKETVHKKDAEVIQEFTAILTEAVKCRVENQKSTGTELSGGIDSSSVAALASQFSKIKTFSHILPDSKLGKIFPHKDEREFIHMLTEHCNISDKHFITSEKSLLDSLQDHLEYYQSLSQQNFGVFSDQLYEKAQQENVTVLLSGFGGDEVITSKASGYLYELAQNSNWQEIKVDLKNQYPKKISFTKSFLKLYIKSKLPGIYNFLRVLKPDKPWWKNKYKNLALNANYEQKLRIKKRYDAYYRAIARETLQEKNIERITHPHVSQRLEYCSLIARKYGIEYRYPLLDIRLIEFYLSVPPRLKARNGIGRYIIRRAMEGILPEKIQWRNDKSGATIPTVFMRMIHNKDQFEQLISSAKQNEIIKKYIDLDKLEQWFYNLSNRTKDHKYVNPGAFYTYIKLILFIEKNPSLFT